MKGKISKTGNIREEEEGIKLQEDNKRKLRLP